VQALLLLQLQHIVEEIVALLLWFFQSQSNASPDDVQEEHFRFLVEERYAVELAHLLPQVGNNAVEDELKGGIEHTLYHFQQRRGSVRETLGRYSQSAVGNYFGGVAKRQIHGVQSLGGGHLLLSPDIFHELFAYALRYWINGLDLTEFKDRILIG